MIKKLLKLAQSPVGDTIVVTKEEAVQVLQYQQQLEMNSMLSEVLINAIIAERSNLSEFAIRYETKDFYEYTHNLMKDSKFLVAEYTEMVNKIKAKLETDN